MLVDADWDGETGLLPMVGGGGMLLVYTVGVDGKVGFVDSQSLEGAAVKVVVRGK